MPTSNKVAQLIQGSSWIRRMFEEGERLKAIHGKDAVFDFTLGNPVIDPPEGLEEALLEAVRDRRPGAHRYMPNPGFLDVRQAVADHLSRVHQRPLGPERILMTVGAAGAMNITLKAILDPGDEVLVLVPYFPEYAFYVDNHGGVLVPVETRADFDLDLDRVAAALGPRTRAVIINSPNNPTGRIYDAATLRGLGELLQAAEQRHGRPIYLLSDEPYRAIVYAAGPLPSVFAAHRHAVICTSHSKDLAIPGERIGYAAIHPEHPGGAQLFDAMAFANRILGFVNAPALMQRVVARLQETQVDPEVYRRRRDLMIAGLRAAGMEIEPPRGAFYLFPRTPIADDVAFTELLKEELVLVVPGEGFGRAGHIRLSYCVPDETIAASLPAFERVARRLSAG